MPDAVTGGGASVRRNIVANYVGQAIASLLALALVPVYIGYLGIEAYAIVGLFAVIQAWMVLLDLGMTPTLGREMARFSAGTVDRQTIHDLLRSLGTIYVAVAILAAVVLTLSADWLARDWLQVETLPVETVAAGLSMLGIVVSLRFCEGRYRSGLMGLQQQIWVNVVGSLLAVLRSIGAWAVLALVSPTVEAFFIWQGLVSLLTLAVLARRLLTTLPAPPAPARFSVPALVGIGRFAAGIFGVTLLALLLTQVDKLLLSRFLPLREFGYYMLASTIAGALYLVSAPIGQAVAPVLVRLAEGSDKSKLSNTYHDASQLVTVVLGPAALLMALFPTGLMLAWSGDAGLAANTAPILAALALGTYINAQLQVPYQLQLAVGWTSMALKLNLIAVIVLLPALFWAVPRYGPISAEVIWLLLNLMYLLVVMPRVHARVLPGELWQWVRADFLVPLLAALLACLPAVALTRVTSLGRLEWLTVLMVTGALAAAAALLAADRIRPRAFDILRRLLR
jgi:O-antigen/teichoic acid export membrane protein